MARNHQFRDFDAEGAGERFVNGQLQRVGAEADRNLTSKLIEFKLAEVAIEIGQHLPRSHSLCQGFSFDQFGVFLPARIAERGKAVGDRKSTRLNSSHVQISYAVFCLKIEMTLIF